MNCIVDRVAIATAELETYLERQANSVAPEPIRIRTPQRKADLKDKTRIRLKTLKNIALDEYGCTSTAQIKKLLQKLGIRLDLRLSSAWNAIVWELRSQLLEVSGQGWVGKRVEIIDCPGNIEPFAPFTVSAVKDGMARLDYIAPLIPVDRLILWQPESAVAA